MTRSGARCLRQSVRWLVLIFVLLPAFVAAAPLAERQVLENGLTLLVASRRALPIVTVNVTVQAGSLWEPEGGAGLAYPTAPLLPRGTSTRAAGPNDEA